MKSLITVAVLTSFLSAGSLAHWAFLRRAAPELIARAPSASRAGASQPRSGTIYISEPALRFGHVGLNDTIRGSFTVVNDTDQSVSLAEPMKSCSCTAAELDRQELPPGEQCTLKFALHTGIRRVPRVETIAVTYAVAKSDAKQQLLAQVYFEPKGVFEVEPAQLILTRANPKATFVVRGNPSVGQHDVIDVRSSHSCVKVAALSLPVVTLELDLETLDEAIINTECIVYTNNPAEDVIRVPVRVRKE